MIAWESTHDEGRFTFVRFVPSTASPSGKPIIMSFLVKSFSITQFNAGQMTLACFGKIGTIIKILRWGDKNSDPTMTGMHTKRAKLDQPSPLLLLSLRLLLLLSPLAAVGQSLKAKYKPVQCTRCVQRIRAADLESLSESHLPSVAVRPTTVNYTMDERTDGRASAERPVCPKFEHVHNGNAHGQSADNCTSRQQCIVAGAEMTLSR